MSTAISILYADSLYPDDHVERSIFGPDAHIDIRGAPDIASLPDAACAAADGLMIFRHFLTATDLRRFPRLRAVVRMGVGYDRLDRIACAARGIVVCNIPDYGTTEVADHAIALALALRRGLLLHHDIQRSQAPAWEPIEHALVRRLGVQTFGIVGLGRIGTATALRARALGFHVMFFDPHVPSGTELALGIERAPTLDVLLPRADVLSLHAPLTHETRGLIGAPQLALLPRDAVLINTARGGILDLDALEAALRSDHLAGAGLDVVPIEPPPEPPHPLMAAYRAGEGWLGGRLIVTPHSAFHSPQAWADIRRKGAETMEAALAGRPQNVVPPDP